MKNKFLIFTLGLLAFCLGSAFTHKPHREEWRKNAMIEEQLDKIKDECYWKIGIVDPQASDSEYQKLSLSYRKNSGSNNQYVVIIDFTSEKKCPHFVINSRLVFTLPDGQRIEAVALPELNKKSTRTIYSRSFSEKCSYVISNVDLYRILTAPSFSLYAPGEYYSVQATFERDTL